MSKAKKNEFDENYELPDDKQIVKCFRCCSQLEAEWFDEQGSVGVVYGGVIFRGTGNYGSTYFDPSPTQPEAYLEVILCDGCAGTSGVKIVPKSKEQLEINELYQQRLTVKFLNYMTRRGITYPKADSSQ